MANTVSNVRVRSPSVKKKKKVIPSQIGLTW